MKYIYSDMDLMSNLGIETGLVLSHLYSKRYFEAKERDILDEESSIGLLIEDIIKDLNPVFKKENVEDIFKKLSEFNIIDLSEVNYIYILKNKDDITKKVSLKKRNGFEMKDGSLTLEKNILSVLMLDEDVLNVIMPIISSDCFSYPKNKIIFKHISDLFNLKKEVDLSNVNESLKEKNELNEVGYKYLVDVFDTFKSYKDLEAMLFVFLNDKASKLDLSKISSIIDQTSKPIMPPPPPPPSSPKFGFFNYSKPKNYAPGSKK